MGETPTAGGVAGWSGASFELRLATHFCVHMLTETPLELGSGTGCVSWIQLQAPAPADDLVVCFDDNSKWAIQAKGVKRIGVSQRSDSHFATAIRQLFKAAKLGQINMSSESRDRLVLAIEQDAATKSMIDFSQWLEQARWQQDWDGVTEVSRNKKLGSFKDNLTSLLNKPSSNELHAFVRKLFIWRQPADDRSNLCKLLMDKRGLRERDATNVIALVKERCFEATKLRGKITRESLEKCLEDMVSQFPTGCQLTPELKKFIEQNPWLIPIYDISNPKEPKITGLVNNPIKPQGHIGESNE